MTKREAMIELIKQGQSFVFTNTSWLGQVAHLFYAENERLTIIEDNQFRYGDSKKNACYINSVNKLYKLVEIKTEKETQQEHDTVFVCHETGITTINRLTKERTDEKFPKQLTKETK